MITNELETRSNTLKAIAAEMMAAARTAPKAKGIDNIEIALVTDDDLDRLSAEMERIAEESGQKFFSRDAANISSCEAVVLIGTHLSPIGINCGYCGFSTCIEKCEKAPAVPCVFNANDLGIAIGSAVSIAADHRIDARVMYSVGKAALNLGLMNDCCYILGIPVSCTGKSPFFDRPAL